MRHMLNNTISVLSCIGSAVHQIAEGSIQFPGTLFHYSDLVLFFFHPPLVFSILLPHLDGIERHNAMSTNRYCGFVPSAVI